MTIENRSTPNNGIFIDFIINNLDELFFLSGEDRDSVERNRF